MCDAFEISVMMTSDELFRSYNGYLTNDYCLTCAYFIQHKGHFGKCKEDPERNDGMPYDGAKKGTACAGWRLKSELITLQNDPSAWEPKVHTNAKKMYLGSLVSGYIRKKLRPRRPRVQHFEKVYDYSYPTCKLCGNRTCRSGHDYTGNQKYRCTYCGSTITVKHVIVSRALVKKLRKDNQLRTMYSARFILRQRFYKRHVFGEERDIIFAEALRLFPFEILRTRKPIAYQCKRCNAFHIVKYGSNKNKSGWVQRYECKDCGLHFCAKTRSYNKENAIKIAVYAYEHNISSRGIRDCFAKTGLHFKHNTIFRWIQKTEEGSDFNPPD